MFRTKYFKLKLKVGWKHDALVVFQLPTVAVTPAGERTTTSATTTTTPTQWTSKRPCYAATRRRPGSSPSWTKTNRPMLTAW